MQSDATAKTYKEEGFKDYPIEVEGVETPENVRVDVFLGAAMIERATKASMDDEGVIDTIKYAKNLKETLIEMGFPPVSFRLGNKIATDIMEADKNFAKKDGLIPQLDGEPGSASSTESTPTTSLQAS